MSAAGFPKLEPLVAELIGCMNMSKLYNLCVPSFFNYKIGIIISTSFD